MQSRQLRFGFRTCTVFLRNNKISVVAAPLRRSSTATTTSDADKQSEVSSDFANETEQTVETPTTTATDEINLGNSSYSGTQDSNMRQASRKRILYMLVGGVLLVFGVAELMYRMSPHGTIGDTIRKLIYGTPYRNYVDMQRGTFIEHFDPAPLYFPSERQFHVFVPESFVKPGLVVNEAYKLRSFGRLTVTDIVSNSLLVEWQRLDFKLRELNQTRYTPSDEILKSCAYQTVKHVSERIGKPEDFHVQRLEYISQGEENGRQYQGLDPVPHFAPTERYPDMVFMVSRIPNKQNNSQVVWVGDLWFINTPYVYHINLAYPPALTQLGESKKQLSTQEYENLVTRVASHYTNNTELKEHMKHVTFQNVTSDISGITEYLRSELLRQLHTSFFKPLNGISKKECC